MGRIHLSLYHTVWPSWVSSRKYEKLKTNEESSSWMLARSLSLKRANERANKVHHRDDQHRFSQSIDALFVLSQLKEYGSDWFSYENIRREDDRKNSNAFMASVGTDDPRCADEIKGHDLENKDVKFNDKETEELCREDDRRDWVEELASMKSEGSDPKCGLEIEGRDDLESMNVEFEDKEIVCHVEEEETRRLSLEDRRSRRVADSFSACFPAEITSRSVKQSLALVKYSYNPYKDFKDSMMEMLVGGNMESIYSDLEELLYCYFSLNPPEHHDLIRKAFMDIWTDLESS